MTNWHMLTLSRPNRAHLMALFGCLSVLAVQAEGKKTPASKLQVTEVKGGAEISIGDRVLELGKRSVYSAEGTVVETKKNSSDPNAVKSHSTMVFSNGTGAYFDADTRVEVKRFKQEMFTPNRADIDIEPSISQTEARLVRGAVGLCTSKPVAGSRMVYETPHAAINIVGRKIVIEASDDMTTISMLEGESSFRAGNLDLGGHILRAGEQATIRPGAVGQRNIIVIAKIPDANRSGLEDKVALACTAKRTVYFDVRDRSESNQDSSVGEESLANGLITAFDDGTEANKSLDREIVPIQVVPAQLPEKFAVSPANLTTSPAPPTSSR